MTKLNLTSDQVEDIVVDELKNTYENILSDWPTETRLTNDVQILDSIEVLLKYYMYVDDAEDFILNAKRP